MKNILNKIVYRLCRKIGIFLFDKQLNKSLIDINSILIINWHGKIGDAIISSFLIREIKEKTNIKISIVTTTNLSELYEIYNVDYIYTIDKKHNIFDLNNLANKIKSIDAIIPLIGTLGFKDLFLIRKLMPIYVFSTDTSLKQSNEMFVQEINNKTVDEIYYKILEFIKIENIYDKYYIPYIENKSQITKYDILFNSFGSRNDKSLSIRKSVSILIDINKVYPNYKIIVIYSPATKDIAQEIVKTVNQKNIILAEDIVTIEDSIMLINESNLIISVDTAIVHIGIGMNKKIIAIYYQPGDIFNVWLPKKTSLIKIVFSLGISNYVKKDMNNFNNKEILNHINFFKA